MPAASPLPLAKPEEVGLSAQRLTRLGDAFKAAIERGRIPGAVALVARRGKLAYLDSFGVRDPASGVAMTPESIFRIYSMTKPIVSTAAMMLVEDGRLLLNDPIANYIPEFKDS